MNAEVQRVLGHLLHNAKAKQKADPEYYLDALDSLVLIERDEGIVEECTRQYIVRDTAQLLLVWEEHWSGGGFPEFSFDVSDADSGEDYCLAAAWQLAIEERERLGWPSIFEFERNEVAEWAKQYAPYADKQLGMKL